MRQKFPPVLSRSVRRGPKPPPNFFPAQADVGEEDEFLPGFEETRLGMKQQRRSAVDRHQQRMLEGRRYQLEDFEEVNFIY